jgi:hypothetical protein
LTKVINSSQLPEKSSFATWKLRCISDVLFIFELLHGVRGRTSR